jgi:hypothetical protein
MISSILVRSRLDKTHLDAEMLCLEVVATVVIGNEANHCSLTEEPMFSSFFMLFEGKR